MGLLCEVCKEVPFKYKCPKCLKQTCSLQCSREHKSQDNCSGKAHDPTLYVSSEVLKDADDEKHEKNALVQRDYNFLTNIKRAVELHKRDGKVKNKRTLHLSSASNKNNPYNKRPRYNEPECQRIIRRGVNCLVLPRGMQRSIANKSKWDKPLDLFVWSIEWVLFPRNQNDSQETFTHISHRIKETDSLIESMGKIIYDKCCDFYNIKTQGEAHPETKVERTRALIKGGLKLYTKWFPYNTIRVLDSKSLVALDPSNKSIAELFRNRTVIEFPTIFVAMDESDISKDYSVIEEPAVANEGEKVQEKALVRSESPSETGSDDEPREESSKQLPIPSTKPLPPISDEVVGSDSDSDGYDPGVTLDFLVD